LIKIFRLQHKESEKQDDPFKIRINPDQATTQSTVLTFNLENENDKE